MGILSWLFHRGNDLTTQFLPDALFFKESLTSGKFPVWNPWIFAGMPYMLDPQNFIWYPPNYILLLFPPETAFIILLVGHLLFAGWAVKKILGKLGNRGYWGALMFVFSPKMTAHIEEGNWTLIMAACWLPALYLGLKRNNYWLTVVSLTAIIINNLNIGYYAVLFVILFWLFQKRSILRKMDPEKTDLFRVLGVAGLMTAPRWLPLAVYGGQTVRSGLGGQVLPFWSWTKIGKSLIFPLVDNHPLLQNEEILYLGIIPILLLILGLKMVIKKRERNMWIIWLLFVLVAAFNEKTPLFNLVKWLPGFSLLRITTRPWIFMSLATALFVPIALKRIREYQGLGERVRKGLVIFLILAIAIDYGYFAKGIFTRREIISDQIPTRFYERMSGNSILVRAYCTTGCLDRLKSQKMGIALLGGNNPVQLSAFVDYLQQAGGYNEEGYHPILPPYTVFDRRPQPVAELLAETATEYVISPYVLTGPKFEIIDQDKDWYLYKNMEKLTDFRDHYFELANGGIF